MILQLLIALFIYDIAKKISKKIFEKAKKYFFFVYLRHQNRKKGFNEATINNAINKIEL
jgi:hypothetical protein